MAARVGETSRFVGSVACVLAILGVLILAIGLAGSAPEAAAAGMFTLIWAVMSGAVAGVVHARARGIVIADQLPTSVTVKSANDGLSALVLVAGFCALASSLPGSNQPAPASVLLVVVLGILAAFSWLLARYFSGLRTRDLPEAPALACWARIGVWQGALPALSELGRIWDPTAPWAAPVNWVGGLTILAIAANEFRSGVREWLEDVSVPFPMVDLAVIRVLGNRSNPLASILDATEHFLGVDLRGSWAIRVVRNGTEPLAISALFLGWLATSLTQVKLHEQGVVERFGRIAPGEVLGPGLHVHFPWPIDHVRRESTARVLSVSVGHESAAAAEDAEGAPENVLWARQHESNEFMFLLGDGRDLVTIDGALRYRIRDYRRYLTANADVPLLLRSLVYAAVTRRTVDRSLDQVLSQNLAGFTHDVAVAVQTDADALELGVEILDMTVGGMHPPVVVAAEYEAVVSAQLEHDTLVIGAHAEAERDIPGATATALDTTSTAEAEAAGTIATAKGASEAFRGIRASFAAEPKLFQYRRRLEALEDALQGRRLMILDDRLERDGATLWVAK